MTTVNESLQTMVTILIKGRGENKTTLRLKLSITIVIERNILVYNFRKTMYTYNI